MLISDSDQYELLDQLAEEFADLRGSRRRGTIDWTIWERGRPRHVAHRTVSNRSDFGLTST